MAISSSQKRFIQFLESKSIATADSPLAISYFGRTGNDAIEALKSVSFAAIVVHETGTGDAKDFAIYHNCFIVNDASIFGFAHPLFLDPRSAVEIDPSAFCDPMDIVSFSAKRSKKKGELPST